MVLGLVVVSVKWTNSTDGNAPSADVGGRETAPPPPPPLPTPPPTPTPPVTHTLPQPPTQHHTTTPPTPPTPRAPTTHPPPATRHTHTREEMPPYGRCNSPIQYRNGFINEYHYSAVMRNCEVYAYLVEKIAPQEKKQFMHSTKAILDAVDLVQRAEMVLQNAEMLDCRVFVRPQDIVSGSQRLNLAFLANLFHGYPALEKPPDVEEKVAEIEETREEKTYRNWINSMGIEPTVNHLFCDLTDGIILLKLFDVIRKNTVDWSQVHDDICKTPAKANFQRLENCNFVVKLGRDFGFSLVGLGGDDLYEGKSKMTLALLWQLMRAYTLSVLTRLTESRRAKKSVRHKDAHGYSPIAETEIIDWANEKLRQGGKQARISPSLGFTDPSLATGNLIIDLIDSIRPGSVNYKVVLPGRSKQVGTE
ncbi:hypothetical protein AHF37_04075 [Paragonimus kellicotti]|nr:hypothetical protein AHF37_04075 [Paragonimus kellicotti]